MNYKDIQGFPTFWKGQHRPLWKRVVYKLYESYINEVFIPKSSEVVVRRYPTIYKKDGVKSIQIGNSYVFADFTKISEVRG